MKQKKSTNNQTRTKDFLDCMGGGIPHHQQEIENDYIDEISKADIKVLEIPLSISDYKLIMSLVNSHSITREALTTAGVACVVGLRNYGRNY